MTASLIATATLVASLVGYDPYATEVTGNACRHCSLAEARQKAIQLAAPAIQCQSLAERTEIISSKQECFSQSETYYVYSKDNNRLHAFLLYHSNQGASSPSDLQLRVDTFAPTVAAQKAVMTSVKWHDAMKAGLHQLSSEFTRAINAPTERVLNASRMSYIRSADSSNSPCSSNPSYRALYDAFSPGFKSDLQQQLNQKLNTLNLGHHGLFEKRRITDSGVKAVFGGVAVSLSIDYATQTDHAEFTYDWLMSAQAEPDNKPPRIVFNLGVDKFGVFARLNERLSEVDGITIGNLTGSSASGDRNNGLSSCAAKALRIFFGSHIKSKTTYTGKSSPRANWRA